MYSKVILDAAIYIASLFTITNYINVNKHKIVFIMAIFLISIKQVN